MPRLMNSLENAGFRLFTAIVSFNFSHRRLLVAQCGVKSAKSSSGQFMRFRGKSHQMFVGFKPTEAEMKNGSATAGTLVNEYVDAWECPEGCRPRRIFCFLCSVVVGTDSWFRADPKVIPVYEPR